MNSIKCPQCGLVNWGMPPACKRCGLSFQDLPEQARVSVPAGEQIAGAGFSYASMAAQQTEQTRKVWKWFVVYCVLMTLLYLLTAGIGAAMLIFSSSLADPRRDAGEIAAQGIAMLLVGLVFTVPYAIAPTIKGKTWGWTYGIVMIAVGLTSCCLWPITIPLIIQWTKPEMKLFFGKS